MGLGLEETAHLAAAGPLDYVGLPVSVDSDLKVWSMPSMQFSDHCPLYGTLTALGPPLRAVRSLAFRLTGWCPCSPEDGRRYRRGLAHALGGGALLPPARRR